MMRRLPAGLICLTALAILLVPDPNTAARELTAADRAFLEKKIMARWELTGRGQIAEAYARGIDVLEDHPDPRKGYITILVTASELNGLLADGYQIQVETYDWYQSYAQKTVIPFGGFRTFTEIEAYLDSIHAAHPTITTAKYSIGLTFQGQTMWAMKISDNPEIDEPEPELLFDALHHAREPASAAVLLETIARLVDGYGPDTLITRLVNEREIFFVPVVNPDGYLYNELVAPNGGGMWRKNRNTLLSPDIGVDLNRNYGYQWGYDNSGSSPDPGDDTYRGASAFSEPETANMRAFINSREFTFVLNYHAYSDLWLWPWGYDYFYTPDELLFSTIADSITTFNGYTPEIGWTLYPTNGDADDWSYGATGEHARILSFTPEVGSGAEGGFWPDPIYIPSHIEENQAPNLLLIDLADAPERVFPAAVPIWIGPTDADTSYFNLTWSDPGGPNAAVSFALREIFGIQRTSDDVESGTGLWTLDGFSVSTARAASGASSYFGGASSWLQSRLHAKNYLHVETDDTLKMNIWYDIENGWDFAYVEVSIDGGGLWVPLEGNVTTNDDPHGNNRGNGITGSSGAFVPATFPLNAYAGVDVQIRLSYVTDGYVLGEGIYFDDISPLVDFDSVTVLEAATTQTSYLVTGKEAGVYAYDLSATDGDGQTSVVTAPHHVTVDFSHTVCACPCHGDPTCDSTHNVFDVVNVVGVAFRNVPPTTDPMCPVARTNVNCDAVNDILDVVITVGVAFRNDNPAVVYCDPCTGP